MSEKTIEQKVADAIVEMIGVKPGQVTPESKFDEDLGMDSLDRIELIIEAEEEFGFEIEESEWEKIQTVQQAIDLIKSKTNANP